MLRLAVAFLLVPGIASAGVVFSEIMYDVPGTEGSGEHDWVEVWNTGASPVDLSAYRFFEANTNHTLKLDRGSATLPPGGVAVIASATSTFLADNPSFSGTLFDSSFNLNSSGELLKLCSGSCSAEGSVVEDSLTYAPIESATNNGNSLQLVSGAWVAAFPTPGGAPSSAGGASGSESGAAAEASPSAGGGGTPLPEPKFVAYAGVDRTVTVGAAAVYEGRIVGTLGQSIENARFTWSFGNGDIREGKSVLYAYPYPGDYVVMLAASSGDVSVTSRILVRASPAFVSISAVTPEYVEVFNAGSGEVDLSFWILRSAGVQFIIPSRTIVRGKTAVRFASGTTGISGGAQDIALLFPNGVEATRFSLAKPVPVLPRTEPSTLPLPAAPVPAKAPEPPPWRTESRGVNAAAAAVAADGSSASVVWVGVLAVFTVVSTAAAVALRRASRKGSGYTITEVTDL